ncbi:MAG: cyclic pyranopterin monophosphate synthase MoaC [Bacillota bacterium]
MSAKFSHLDDRGRAKMVDVTDKDISKRKAVAAGEIKMNKKTLKMIKEGSIKKGAVLETARIAGIMGVKNTPDLIPMCHPLLISGIDIEFEFRDERTVEIKAVVKNSGKTGVEMEALTGVSTAALTIYDMCKAVDKKMEINNIRLLYKSGGQSGEFKRKDVIDD